MRRPGLGLWASVWSTLVLGQTPAPPAAQPPAGAPPAGAPTESAPRNLPPADDEFIEFLGTDDVGDAAWWEFLKRSAPGMDPPRPAAPPQDAKS